MQNDMKRKKPMPLFRFHRGGLHESLETTVVVKSPDELRKVITNSIENWPTTNKDFGFITQAYPAHNNFDPRIGWYTQMVTADIYNEGVFVVVGFLSEEFSNEPVV
jgi:hypothetical protein